MRAAAGPAVELDVNFGTAAAMAMAGDALELTNN